MQFCEAIHFFLKVDIAKVYMKDVNVQLDTAVLFGLHENFIRFVAVGGFIVNKQAGKSNYWKQIFHAVLACHNCLYLCGFLIPPQNA